MKCYPYLPLTCGPVVSSTCDGGLVRSITYEPDFGQHKCVFVDNSVCPVPQDQAPSPGDVFIENDTWIDWMTPDEFAKNYEVLK